MSPLSFVWLVVGLVLGIGLNSLADNLPPDVAGVRRGPRPPRCAQCGQVEPPGLWWATARWLVRGGRCPHCQHRESLRPVLTEWAAGLGLAYLWFWAAGQGYQFFTASVIWLTFLLLTVIDLEHRLILGNVIWPTVVAIAVLNSLDPSRGPVKTLIGGGVGYLLVGLLFFLGQFYGRVVAQARGEPLEEVVFGGGDVNLAAAIGVATGWSGILFALVITVFAGGFFSLGYIVVQVLRRRYNPHTPIPYGPFLVFGGLVMYLYGPEFVNWYLRGGRP